MTSTILSSYQLFSTFINICDTYFRTTEIGPFSEGFKYNVNSKNRSTYFEKVGMKNKFILKNPPNNTH